MKTGAPSQRAKAAKPAKSVGRAIARPPNLSAAVSAQRFESKDSLDDFPTQPWAGRAWLRYVADEAAIAGQTAWEPAANRGYLIRGLSAFKLVHASDVFDYGVGFKMFDFSSLEDTLIPLAAPFGEVDWIITNPPFNKLMDFVRIALRNARVGVAIFCRTQALEGADRYEAIFERYADRYAFSQFTERVSLVRGTLDPSASRPAAYGWLTIWKEPQTAEFLVARRHIPPCREQLERPGDYEPAGNDARLQNTLFGA